MRACVAPAPPAPAGEITLQCNVTASTGQVGMGTAVVRIQRPPVAGQLTLDAATKVQSATGAVAFVGTASGFSSSIKGDLKYSFGWVSSEVPYTKCAEDKAPGALLTNTWQPPVPGAPQALASVASVKLYIWCQPFLASR